MSAKNLNSPQSRRVDVRVAWRGGWREHLTQCWRAIFNRVCRTATAFAWFRNSWCLIARKRIVPSFLKFPTQFAFCNSSPTEKSQVTSKVKSHSKIWLSHNADGQFLIVCAALPQPSHDSVILDALLHVSGSCPLSLHFQQNSHSAIVALLKNLRWLLRWNLTPKSHATIRKKLL